MNEIDINKSDIFLNSQYVKTNLFKDFFPNIFWDPFCCLHMESDFCFCADCGLKMVDLLLTCTMLCTNYAPESIYFHLKLNCGNLCWHADPQDRCFCCKIPSNVLIHNTRPYGLIHRINDMTFICDSSWKYVCLSLPTGMWTWVSWKKSK